MTPEELKERDEAIFAVLRAAPALPYTPTVASELSFCVRLAAENTAREAAAKWDAAHAPKPCCSGEPESWSVAIGDDVVYQGPLSGVPKVLQDTLVSVGLVSAPKPEAPRIEIGTWVGCTSIPDRRLRQVAYLIDRYLIFADEGIGNRSDYEPVARIDIRPGDCVRAVLEDGSIVDDRLDQRGQVSKYVNRWLRSFTPKHMSLLALPCGPKDDRLNPPKEV